MTSLDKKYAKTEDMVARNIGEETILVPINQRVGDLDNVYTLNETAAFIWEYIDGERTLAAIKDLIIDEFDVSPELAEQDLLACIAQLEEMKGIEIN